MLPIRHMLCSYLYAWRPSRVSRLFYLDTPCMARSQVSEFKSPTDLDDAGNTMNGIGVNIYTNNNEWLRIVACELIIWGIAAHKTSWSSACRTSYRDCLQESLATSFDEVSSSVADKFLFMFQVCSSMPEHAARVRPTRQWKEEGCPQLVADCFLVLQAAGLVAFNLGALGFTKWNVGLGLVALASAFFGPGQYVRGSLRSATWLLSQQIFHLSIRAVASMF